MVVRDQYVGRYQVPVADCAVTASALIPVDGKPMTGEAMSMGERTPVALINPAASARALPLPKPLPISRGRISPNYQTLPCRRTGWQPVVRTKKTKPCLMRCMPWAKPLSAKHLALPFLGKDKLVDAGELVR